MSEEKKLLAVVVEDMPDLSELIQRELVADGWEVSCYGLLIPAIDRIKTLPYPEAVILDLNLPDSNVRQTASRIGEIMKYSATLVTSGYAEPEVVRQIEATGAVFLNKRDGSAPQTFLSRLVQAMGLYRTKHLKEVQESLTGLRHYLAHNGR